MTLGPDLVSDARFTFRLFRSNISFSLVAILSLALGIGATSAIFSLIYAVLVDPYPYRDSARIIAPTFINQQGRQGRIFYTIPDYQELRQNSKTIEDAFLAEDQTLVATRGLPERVKGIAFSPGAFEFMGVPALLGRTFSANDIRVPQAPPQIAVLSYLFWRRHFNGDPAIVGKTVELNHRQYSIMGVVPPRFTWSDADVYVPLAMEPDARKEISLMLRVKPGFSLGAVNAEMQMFTERFAKRSPNVYPKQFRMHVERLNDWLLGKFQGTLLILMAAVGFLLLIACGNVSILLLSRAEARRREIAIRVSIGATRARILQQLLTESVLLSLAGGLFGVLLAYQGVPAIVAMMPMYSVPHEAAIGVNAAVVLFSFLIAVSTGVLFGLAPAMQLTGPGVQDAARESGRSLAGSRRGSSVQSLLIVAEVALTVVLLAGAVIAIRGFVALTKVRLGYDPSNVLALDLPGREGARKTWQTRNVFYQRVLESLQNTPGVKSAAISISAMPPWVSFNTPFELEDGQKDPNRMTLVGLVGGDYFSTLHIGLLRGRSFSAVDFQHPEPVAVINEAMLRQYWPDGRDPIGTRIHIAQLNFKDNPEILNPPTVSEWVRIIGVVATARNRGLRDEAKPAVYVPYTLVLPPGCAYLVRTEGDPHRIVNALRAQVRAVDPDQPVTEVMTLDESLARWERAYPRFSTTLFSIFAVAGLLLAATGLYSVVSYAVSRRTHEFGIRMAVGAQGADILRLVTAMTTRLMLAGLLIGVACSFALSRVIANYLDAWNPKDPMALLAVVLVLGIVAMAACSIPARRAISIEPIAALREE